MTLPVPLGVRLASSSGDRRITLQMRDLTIRSVDPGGFASASINLNRDLTDAPDELEFFSRLYVYDERSGATVWEGRVEDIGRSATGDGTVWEINAVGPAVHATDLRIPYIVVDNDIAARWRPSDLNSDGAQVTTTDEGDEDPAWRLSPTHGVPAPDGAPVGFTSGIKYRALYDTGQEPARVRIATVNATVNTNWENRIITRSSPTSSGIMRANDTWSTSTQFLAAAIGGIVPLPTSGARVVEIRIQRFNTGVGGSNAFARVSGISVRSMLKDADGTDRTDSGDYTDNTVTSDEVVNDILGRLLPDYDGPNASVAAGTLAIDHLCWPDGISAAEVLDELIALESGAYTWAAWESNDDGLYRFEWKLQPTTVRYEASTVDGFEGPTSASDLYNEALVRYVDWAERRRTRTVTQDVPALDDAGITRTLDVDLGDNVGGSSAQADAAGARALAEHQYPPNGGTLTVARPIRDLIDGGYVMPWEILPGELIRVRDLSPHTDALNATARNGSTVFHIRSTEFSVADAAASLELDAYSRSMARAIAEIQSQPKKRRRR